MSRAKKSPRPRAPTAAAPPPRLSPHTTWRHAFEDAGFLDGNMQLHSGCSPMELMTSAASGCSDDPVTGFLEKIQRAVLMVRSSMQAGGERPLDEDIVWFLHDIETKVQAARLVLEKIIDKLPATAERLEARP